MTDPVRVERIELQAFRSYRGALTSFGPGLTVVRGDNGEGKTNLLEAVVFTATLRSFRGVPADAMVRQGEAAAVLRATWSREGRELLVETELPATGRPRLLLNRQRVTRREQLLEQLPVTVFQPSDLEVVQGGPSGRRSMLDDLLVALDPRLDQLVTEVDRVLRQRNALLRQAGGRLDADGTRTLDVWDERLAGAGERLVAARHSAIAAMVPEVVSAHHDVVGREVDVAMDYRAEWTAEGLAAALAGSRRDDLRRGVSTVGPHRDDVDLRLGGLSLRTQASQGEQRTMALALRLAAHRLTAARRGVTPLLVLDDVVSELDERRSAALLDALPAGQVLLSTAVPLHLGDHAADVVTVSGGVLSAPPVGTDPSVA